MKHLCSFTIVIALYDLSIVDGVSVAVFYLTIQVSAPDVKHKMTR